MNNSITRPSAATRRCLTLLDVVVIIGATALGLGSSRFLFREYLSLSATAFFAEIVGEGIYSAVLLAPCAACWSCALFTLRLRKPRPICRRLFRQPGFVASLAIVVNLVVAIVFLVPVATMDRRKVVQSFIMGVGPSIISSWLVLALSGRWRAEQSWLDRLGIVFGVIWIAIYGIYAVFLGFWTR